MDEEVTSTATRAKHNVRSICSGDSAGQARTLCGCSFNPMELLHSRKWTRCWFSEEATRQSSSCLKTLKLNPTSMGADTLIQVGLLLLASRCCPPYMTSAFSSAFSSQTPTFHFVPIHGNSFKTTVMHQAISSSSRGNSQVRAEVKFRFYCKGIYILVFIHFRTGLHRLALNLQQVILQILAETPQAARLSNKYGSLCLHIACQRNDRPRD